ncbi:MAG: hypothetical protein ABSF90_25435 [Syntrophobacteraceae bacterium]|jgi:hypothetical protein
MSADQSRKALRIALIFPPAMPPTSPPLGIAALKPYLETLSTVEVRNFDLNLAYFEQAFHWLGDGRLRMRMQKMDFETTARKATAARRVFTGFSIWPYTTNRQRFMPVLVLFSMLFSMILQGRFFSNCRRPPW